MLRKYHQFGISFCTPLVSLVQRVYYRRPLSVSRRPYYILPMFFIYLFIFLWPPYSPAVVNGSSRKFYTWWTLSIIREVTTWIFSWSSLNYRLGQKGTKFGIFRPRPQTFCSHARTRQNIVILKKVVKHRWLLYT